ncbi:MAG: hypothetical protein NVSMB53_09180 [Gemmatimonadaceae bacterium]
MVSALPQPVSDYETQKGTGISAVILRLPSYAIGPDFIAVQFHEPTVHIYDDTRPGSAHLS